MKSVPLTSQRRHDVTLRDEVTSRIHAEQNEPFAQTTVADSRSRRHHRKIVSAETPNPTSS